MYDNDFLNFFNGVLNSTKVEGNPQKINCEDELNAIWNEYNNFVQELKDEGYKVLRNSDGRHKVVKDSDT